MKKIHLITAFVLTLSIFLFNVKPVKASPPLPSSFHGTVKIDGVNVPAGTVVSAWINGVQYRTATVVYIDPNMQYNLNVPGDDPATTPAIEGGKEGDTVFFHIGELVAGQTGTWHSGT